MFCIKLVHIIQYIGVNDKTRNYKSLAQHIKNSNGVKVMLAASPFESHLKST